MSETVYLETSVIGYPTARSTQNLVIAGNIETTRDWWQKVEENQEDEQT